MKHRSIKKRQKGGAPKWMVTYSDMVTLILVFFILLFSMSQIDQNKFETISESFKNRMIFDFQPSPIPNENPSDATSGKEKDLNEYKDPSDARKLFEEEEDESDDRLETLVEDVESYLDKHDLNNVISADRSKRGVVLVLQELILFNPEKAEVRESGKGFLNKIGALLQRMPNQVKVEGHTDTRPMSSFKYPSNWELSGARASSVIRYLTDQYDFDKSRFSLAGYGDTQPLVPNDSPENMKQNRRVEIVIMEDDNQSSSD